MLGVQMCKRQGCRSRLGPELQGLCLGPPGGCGQPSPGAGLSEATWTPQLTLQLADAAGDALELSLPLLPPLHGGDHQLPAQFLSHDQVGRIDVIHLLAGALQAVFEPQH